MIIATHTLDCYNLSTKEYFNRLKEECKTFQEPQRRCLKISFLYRRGFSFWEVDKLGLGFSTTYRKNDDII